MSNTQRKPMHEDWAAVITGGITIILFLVGLQAANPGYKWDSFTSLQDKVLGLDNLQKAGLQFIVVAVLSGFASWLTGKSLSAFFKGFGFVFGLSLLASIIAGNKGISEYNLETVIFSLAFGLFLNNFFTMPSWLKASLNSELYVKIGLVLLGTTVLFSNVLEAGVYGLIQALIVVVCVWYFAFWLSKKMGIDEEMGLMISSAVSICGVSAAIATSGAIKGDSKKLSYVISMVLITAVPMMILMPYAAQWMGLSETVTGAWLGGSIDTTGAVAASGSLVGEKALEISTIIKFSQNVLLGLAAFAISVYWSVNQSKQTAEKPTLGVIWKRFPKFVVGFVVASILFSFFLPKELVSTVSPSIKSMQNLWFSLAFVCIGLETNFKELFSYNNKKPFYAFLIAQGFNVILTLIIAYFLFSS